jgi:hypothetical protein
LIRSTTRLSRRQLSAHFGRSLLTQRLRERFSFTGRFLYLRAMIEVLDQRRVDAGQRQVVFGCDLVSALAHALVPDRYFLDRDPQLAARNSGRDLDVIV